MSRIFITGSSDGLGQLAAKALVAEGHEVVLHARSAARGEVALQKVPGAKAVLTADLADQEQTKQLAADVNAMGRFDAVIHNAGVYQASGESIVAVNTLAPYLLTCLIHPPKRLIYLSSGMHKGGQPNLGLLGKDQKSISYADSKLQVLLLTMAVARLWPGVYANAVDPGWVPTKMGGAGAPDDLTKGYQTQTWLATSNDAAALVSGQYFFHQQPRQFATTAAEVPVQDELLAVCEQLTGVSFPSG